MNFESPAIVLALRQHVQELAGKIGERHIWQRRELHQAQNYIEETFEGAGHSSTRETFFAEAERVSNVIIEIKGAEPAEGTVVVGAHYDSAVGTPGANDNASAIAVLLELAKIFSRRALRQNLRLVAFVNEEMPFFRTSSMGSFVHAANARKRNESVSAMLSLEMLGCFFDYPGTQQYPFPLQLLYPNTGNFVGFVSNLGSASLMFRCLKAFRKGSSFPAQGVVAPGWITGIGWSDHSSFWSHGYQAAMVTDTAFFRYRHYHLLSDTPDKIQYEKTAEVVIGLVPVIEMLCGGQFALADNNKKRSRKA